MLTRRDALAGLAAGFAASAVTRPALAADRVRIGYQKMGSLALLKQQGRLEAQRMAVEWVEFNSGPRMLVALNAGAVDFAATGDTPPIFAQAAGADLVYVGAQPLTGAAEALLVAQTSAVHSLADLPGKRIAFTKGSSAHNFSRFTCSRRMAGRRSGRARSTPGRFGIRSMPSPNWTRRPVC
jgi:ABC-type nitrate/sulfonate/bicarbonate transport system substrate-binding protein